MKLGTWKRRYGGAERPDLMPPPPQADCTPPPLPQPLFVLHIKARNLLSMFPSLTLSRALSLSPFTSPPIQPGKEGAEAQKVLVGEEARLPL